jgi:hypothetical protein
MFEKAIKQEAKLRLAIAGPSGSGKTYTALAVARDLCGDKRVALVDTEHGSASKYADIFDFDVLEMEPPFHPDRFGRMIAEAQGAGYGVIVLDSLSHAWNGTGGLLEIVDQIAARSSSKNTFAAWKQGTPIYNHLIDSIIQSDIHVIATMRTKQDYILVEKEKDGRKYQAPEKVGMAPIQRDGFEYEFDIVLTLDNENLGTVTKTRCPALQGGYFPKPGTEFTKIVTGWLAGVPALPKKTVEYKNPEITPEQPAKSLQGVKVPAPAPQPSTDEQIDPMGDWAVKYAAHAWGKTIQEAAAEIARHKLGKHMSKDAFMKLVNPQPDGLGQDAGVSTNQS